VQISCGAQCRGNLSGCVSIVLSTIEIIREAAEFVDTPQRIDDLLYFNGGQLHGIADWITLVVNGK
jgi:hypothetical protein